jgi:hypothetical protein
MSATLDRRDLLKLLSASVLAGPLQLTAAEKDKPLFFSPDEFELLDTLTEQIIPTDSHSPGAHAAGVPFYIDRTVAEAFLPDYKEAWKTGLAELNRLSFEEHKHPYLKIGKEKQLALLALLAKAEQDPKTAGEKFFALLKEDTAYAYYTSDIGIHKDIEYKGNVIQMEFAGYDAV